MGQPSNGMKEGARGVTPSEQMGEMERLVRTYGNDVLRLATAILGSIEQAEDVHQETFLRVIRSWSGFRRDASEKTWITGIAVNVCRDMMRSAYKKRVVVSDEAVELSPDMVTDDEAEHQVNRTIVKDAMEKLPVHLKEVLVLFYYHDLDVKAIADIQKVPQGTVKSRLFKARTEMARLMGGEANAQGLV